MKEEPEDDQDPIDDDESDLKSFEEMTISEKRDFINDLRNGHNPNLDNQTNDDANLGNEDSSIKYQNDVADEKLSKEVEEINQGLTAEYMNIQRRYEAALDSVQNANSIEERDCFNEIALDLGRQQNEIRLKFLRNNSKLK